MRKNLIDLASQRRLLLEKINTQRVEVVEISLQLHKPLALVDAGIKAVNFICSHPVLVTSGVALLLAFRRGNLTLLAHEGWHLLSLYPATANLSQFFSYQRRDTRVD